MQVDAEDGDVALVPTPQYRKPVEDDDDVRVRGGSGGQSSTPWRLMSSVWSVSDDADKYRPSPCWEFIINPQPKVNAVSSVFYRTLTVAISPKFVVVNNSDTALHVCQGDAVWHGLTPPVLVILPRQEREFFWTHSKLSRFVSLSLPGYDWTGPIDLSTIGEVSVRVCRDLRVPKPPDSDMFLRITTSSHDSFGTLIVSVHRDGSSTRYPMYRLDNQSSYPVLCRQYVEPSPSSVDPIHDRAVFRVRPQQSQVFGWDSPVDAMKKPMLQLRSPYLSTILSVNMHDSGYSVEMPADEAVEDDDINVVCYDKDYCMRACENLWTVCYQAPDAAHLSAFSVSYP